MQNKIEKLISKLDLKEYIEGFALYLAREKPLYMEGDTKEHYRFITLLSKYDFTAPFSVKDLSTHFSHIKKFGVLRIYEIYEFIKIVNYFKYLKKQPFEGDLQIWMQKIIIPEEIDEICGYFDDKGGIKPEIDENLLMIENTLKINKEHTGETLRRIMSSKKLDSYLVDNQIHYINEEEALLVRGGFNHVLKGSVAARSSSGFFYVVPESVRELKKKEAELLSQKEEVVYKYCKDISSLFGKKSKFLSFIDKEFDRFDAYQARVFFAKSKDLEFLLPENSTKMILKDFSHPALKDPKPVSVDFSKKVLFVTGVNAGGKTMLLKSILSAALLSKYLLPMRINTSHSKIGKFKQIYAILDDPQSVKNDISTFAGRMVEFKKLFSKKDTLIGVDEIELGTDADEAASLFKVILEKLIERGLKIIVTTHHKRLASLMATHDEAELLAALYDEKNRRPTYEFLQGTIGKSYAFETALRYGIPQTIIGEAKTVYGEDKEKLNDLIQKNIDLELQMKKKTKELDAELEKANKLQVKFIDEKEQAEQRLSKLLSDYDKEYKSAVDEAKKALKQKDSKDIHKQLNIANKIKRSIKKEASESKKEFHAGDRVKYGNSKGYILSIKKSEAIIDCDGVKLRVPVSKLKLSGHTKKIKPKKNRSAIERPSTSSIKLDLHGLRAEEALEKLDKFLSDALMVGYDEVLVYHGIGTGRLAFVVKEFLKTYPKIKSFTDAPPNMGGFGATLIKL